MPLLTGLCDRMIALELGAVIAEGTPAEVLAHPRVIESLPRHRRRRHQPLRRRHRAEPARRPARRGHDAPSLPRRRRAGVAALVAAARRRACCRRRRRRRAPTTTTSRPSTTTYDHRGAHHHDHRARRRVRAAAAGSRPADPAGLAAQIADRRGACCATPRAAEAEVATAALAQQVAYRQLGDHPEWDAAVLAALPGRPAAGGRSATRPPGASSAPCAHADDHAARRGGSSPPPRSTELEADLPRGRRRVRHALALPRRHPPRGDGHGPHPGHVRRRRPGPDAVPAGHLGGLRRRRRHQRHPRRDLRRRPATSPPTAAPTDLARRAVPLQPQRPLRAGRDDATPS